MHVYEYEYNGKNRPRRLQHDQGTMYNSFFTAVASNQGLLICRETSSDLAPGERLLLFPHASFYYYLFARAHYDGFIISYRNQTDRPLYRLCNILLNATLRY